MRTRHRPRLAALVLAGALTATTAVATAAPKVARTTTLITLSGNGSSYVDVVLPRNLTVDTAQAQGDDSPWRAWSWHGCGAYRGFYLQPLDDSGLGAGEIDFATFDFAPGRRHVQPVGESPLDGALIPAGLTRVHLLAAAPCTLSLRLLGGGALSIRTKHPEPVHVAAATLDLSAGTERAGGVRWDVAVNRGTMLMTYVRSVAVEPALGTGPVRTGSLVQTTPSAVTCSGGTTPQEMSPDASGGGGYERSAGLLTEDMEDATWYRPGTFPATTCTVTVHAGGALTAKAVAAYVAFDLVGPEEGSSPPCASIVPSPTFGKDHVLMCTTSDGVYVSTDAGRHWRRPLARGLVIDPPLPLTPVHIEFSPLFATDHTIYAHPGGGPLFATTDLGDTFTVADAATYGEDGMSFVPFVHTGPPLDDETALTYGDYGDRQNWVLQPRLHVRTPGFDVDAPMAVALPRRYPAEGPAFLIGPTDSTTGPAATPLMVYQCIDELTCTSRFGVPVSRSAVWVPSDSWLGGVPGRQTVNFVLRGATDGVTAWRSLDGGRTFSSWSGLTRLLVRDARRDAGRPDFALAHNPAFPHRVYLRVSRVLDDRASRSVSDEAVYRSDDDGTTWRQVAGLWSAARGGGGTLPWTGFVRDRYPGRFELASDGSLFATGWVRGTHRAAVFRSTDGGVHWHEART